MVFLLQVFAPDERVNWAKLRVIYLFCCKRGICYTQGNAFRAFRCQLPMENAYYEASMSNSFKELITLPILCDLCGFREKETYCSACQTFLSSHHQESKKSFNGKSRHEKPYESSLATSKKPSSFLFPEYGIDMQAEEIHPDHDFDEEEATNEETENKDDNQKLMMDDDEIKHDLNLSSRKLEKIPHDDIMGECDSQDDDEEEMQEIAALLESSLEDQTFLKFMRRTQVYPKQILR